MPRSRQRTLVTAVYLGTFMVSLAISIVSVALPAIQTNLKTDLSGLQWVVGSYALCLSAFMLSAGPISDRYGRKRTWLIGVALFTVGSGICSIAPSLTLLIAGCSVQGIGGAFVIPGALSILTQAFDDPVERGHVIGGWASFSAVSLILGPLLGGILVDVVGWQSIFLINLPLGATTVCLGMIGIQENADPEHAALDPVGQLLSIVFLGALTYGLIGAGQAGWTNPITLIALGLSAISFIAFILAERCALRPALPLDLFKDWTFFSFNFASFVLGFSGYTSLFFFSLFLQQAQGWSASATGWRMMPVFLVMSIVASLFGRMTARVGTKNLMILGYGFIGLSMITMASFGPTTPYLVVAILFGLLGIGLGLAVPATGAAVMSAAPRERTGAASATMNVLRQGGMTIGIALLGTLMSARAISSMASRLREASVDNASIFATTAVRHHEMMAGYNMAQGVFRALLAQAISDGFSLAVMCSGILGLVAVGILLASGRGKSA